MKFGSLFTGGGGVDIGAKQAGLEVVWGVEYDEEICAWANSQLGMHVICADILELDPHTLEKVDILHASPPCPSFSVANQKRGETEQDLALAHRVAHFIEVLAPKGFTLENVYLYRKSKSWEIIKSQLEDMGYEWEMIHANMADWGVPQKRKRMIVRAVRGKLPALEKTHEGNWNGWYGAVEDIIDSFPPSKLAPWQIRRLQGRGLDEFLDDVPVSEGALLVDGVLGSYGSYLSVRREGEPAMTVTTSRNLRDRKAVLVDGANAGKQGPVHETMDSPSKTVTAKAGTTRAVLVEGVVGGPRPPKLIDEADPAPTMTAGKGGKKHRAIISRRVVALTVRAQARFQTFPDWYALPEKKTLAMTIIGNAVPPEFAAKMLESIKNA